MLIRVAVYRMAFAIMEFEGYRKGSVSYKNNNPGNIKFAGQTGATGGDTQGHAKFTSFQTGWDALINQLTMMFDGRSRVYKKDMSITKVFSIYAEGNSSQYAIFVAARLDVTPDTKLKDLIG
jgi:hypothetical protein